MLGILIFENILSLNMKPLVLLSFFLCFLYDLNAQNITTIAGNQTPGFSGDGGPALLAELNLDINSDITIDQLGNIYFIDKERIRRIDAAGIISTIAGTGIAGYSGDNGPAVNAQFNNPNRIISDSFGNIFISDRGNQRIRKINQNSIITTIAGNGMQGYFGDGGSAIAAQLNNTSGMAFDLNGNLLIVDGGNRRIRSINSSGIINTIAGNGVFPPTLSGDGGLAVDAGLLSPQCIVVDNTGNIYLSDNSSRIRKIDLLGIITTFAGNGIGGFTGDGGNALSAQIAAFSLTIDPIGNIYFVGSHKIRKIDINGIITSVAGNTFSGYFGDNGPAIASQISTSHICTDNFGNLYLTEMFIPIIRKIGDCVPIQPQICMVTVDSTSTNNEIYWDKLSAYLNADTFYIYRDTANYAFGLIGKVPASGNSMYTDTNRSLYGADGDPNITYWRYKIAYHDSCSNTMSPMSPWHQTIYHYNLGGLFLWNHYQIEGQTTPVPLLSNYILRRKNDLSSNNWVVAATASAASNNINDPQFAIFENVADWKIETQWPFMCSPDQDNTIIYQSSSNSKKGSVSMQNIEKNLLQEFILYPNPNEGLFTFANPTNIGSKLIIIDSFGQVVYQNKLSEQKTEINLNHCAAGVYFFKIEREVNQPRYGKIVIKK
jgi:hypothetical protein